MAGRLSSDFQLCQFIRRFLQHNRFPPRLILRIAFPLRIHVLLNRHQIQHFPRLNQKSLFVLGRGNALVTIKLLIRQIPSIHFPKSLWHVNVYFMRFPTIQIHVFDFAQLLQSDGKCHYWQWFIHRQERLNNKFSVGQLLTQSTDLIGEGLLAGVSLLPEQTPHKPLSSSLVTGFLSFDILYNCFMHRSHFSFHREAQFSLPDYSNLNSFFYCVNNRILLQEGVSIVISHFNAITYFLGWLFWSVQHPLV